ncbi:MAG: Cys-tRNA(Pro) deacylase [Oscillospiraceae bacterium]|nr:Cys-tRNA(Pro) deacylase [Oscillospiraceae bacterium]
MDKTNVMRILDQKKIAYNQFNYDQTIVDGVSVAAALDENADHVFKTLVTVGNNGVHFVFVVPVACNLNLKKAAKIVGVKSIDMIKQKELLPLTGYIHGGCSPIGMKKLFRTVIHESARGFNTIFVSAGRVGYQVEINANSLSAVIQADFAEIIDAEHI